MNYERHHMPDRGRSRYDIQPVPPDPGPPPIGWGFDREPTEAEKKFPPLLQTLIDELIALTNADRSMVETLSLGFAALAVQGAFNQVRPNCEPAPCSLFTLSLAPTSAFKSTIIRMLAQPFFDFQDKEVEAKKETALYDEMRAASWKIKEAECKRRMKRAFDDPEKLARLESVYMEILADKPEHKRPARHVYTDSTWQALAEGLHELSPSAAIVAREAEEFFGGPLAAYMTALNDAWDGAPLIVDRKTSASFTVRSPRLSLILALQDRPFMKFVKRRGEDADEFGFLARILVAQSGKVDRTNIAGKKNVSDDARKKYWAWVTELLHRRGSNSITMEDDAKAQWIKTYEWLAQAMQARGIFEPIENYVAKSPENIARIATIFQAADDPASAAVSLVNMRRAILVCRQYVQNYIDVFGALYVPLVVQDAEKIKAWLLEEQKKSQFQFITVTRIQQHTWGGRDLRHDRKRIEAALRYLEAQGVVRLHYSGRDKQVELLNQWSSRLQPQHHSGLFSLV